MGQDTPSITMVSTSNIIALPCPAPAPLAMNGAAYVGCNKPKGHEGPHEVIIRWAS